jgi:hypothetical protein
LGGGFLNHQVATAAANANGKTCESQDHHRTEWTQPTTGSQGKQNGTAQHVDREDQPSGLKTELMQGFKNGQRKILHHSQCDS